MKFLVFAVAFLIAGTSALPQTNDVELMNKEQRLVTGVIRDIIQEIRKFIQENNLDPLLIDRAEYNYNIPLFLNVRLFVEDLTFVGASNIRFNNLDYSVLLNRLRFDIELPLLGLEIGNSGVEANILGNEYDINFKGSSSISRIRLSGEVRVNVGIISGISIRSMEIKFSLGGITSDLNLILFGDDLSPELNHLLNHVIPVALKTYENEINQLLTDVIRTIADFILG
ncbi:uncharacterized protein LOC123703577 [Colias croceus]|uniref:uncharacterized protein LOC123703577 n=1 Tax=Colias crocea TaxID=72248 RepID=UPI001E27D03E|nr:uncharacterized protein LOC123703577 [Colias croceus]XP_045507624.1 uncharacterized protein LOC123703577 [Colias croceus]